MVSFTPTGKIHDCFICRMANLTQREVVGVVSMSVYPVGSYSLVLNSTGKCFSSLFRGTWYDPYTWHRIWNISNWARKHSAETFTLPVLFILILLFFSYYFHPTVSIKKSSLLQALRIDSLNISKYSQSPFHWLNT